MKFFENVKKNLNLKSLWTAWKVAAQSGKFTVSLKSLSTVWRI